MKASSSKVRYADNNDDVINDQTKVEKNVDDHNVVYVDGENANGVGYEKCLIMRRKNIDLKKQATLGFKPISEGDIAGGSLATHSFSQERCRKALAQLCIKDNQPFSIVDNEAFQDYSWEMNPLFKMSFRWTNVNYMCLMAHWVDDDWVLRKKILNFCLIANHRGGSLATHSFSQERCRKALAQFCIKDNQPFSIVDNEGFQDYSWEMNPLFKMSSRWTNVNYMCLTAHWVDDDWVLRKKILNFCLIANHRVTVDNASSNDGAIKFLGKMLKGPHAVLDCKYLHLRCCAHILNLVVRDGLEEQLKSISNIRNAVRLKLIDHKYRSYFYGDDEDDFADEDKQKRAMAALMKDKYDKYWDNINNINFLLMKEDRVNARNKKNSAYSTSDSSLFTSGAKVSLETSFLKYLEEQGDGVNKTEVDTYLDDVLEKRDDSSDILNWWKVNSLKFSILSQVATHVLGMPTSTVASESAFSTGGRVIDQFRSSLTPKTAEALICTQD
nr:zinc finger BED domain-containing protein RICESLEEPER 2-like [Tanacetum cinerariifolium]